MRKSTNKRSDYTIHQNRTGLFHAGTVFQEDMPGGYFVTRPAKGYPFHYVSDKLLKILGYNREEFEKQFHGLCDLLVGESKKKAENYDPSVLIGTGRQYNDRIVQMQSAYGILWVNASLSLVDNKEESYIHGIITDVTSFVDEMQKKNENERELLMNLKLLRASIQKTYQMSIDLNLTKRRFRVIASDENLSQVDNLTGNIDDFIRNGLEYIPGKDQKEIFVNTFSPDNIVREIENGKKEITLRHLYVSGSGIIHWVETKVIVIDGNDSDLHVVMMSKIVDEEVAAEEQEKIVQVLGSEYTDLYVVDLIEEKLRIMKLDGENIEGFDKGDSSMVYPYKMFCEKFILNKIHKEDLPEIKSFLSIYHIRDFFDDKDSFHTVFRSDIKGKIHYIQFKCFKMPTSSKRGTMIIFALKNIDDVMERELEDKRRLELAKKQADAANRAKTMFLFNMSHDIRTPMNAVLGFSKLADMHLDDPEKVHNYLKNIHISGERLLDIINNILELARIENEKIVIEECPHNVTECFEEDIVMFEHELEKRNLTLTKVCNVDYPYIYMDPAHTSEIMLNLLSNAIKYTRSGGKIRVTLNQHSYDPNGFCILEYIVEDTGIGMSEEFQAHIFEAFEREKTATECGVQGTGLGMGIVKKLVDLMNGTIEVESQLGVGTKFTLKIPVRLAKKEDVGVKLTQYQENDEFLKGKRVLLAEDNDLNAEIAMELLNNLGILVERAADGVECVDMVEKSESGYYDLILMDIQMPNMDGYKATGVIRQLKDAGKAGIPIIAVTANAFDEDKQNAFEAGMDAHLAKPIDIEKMIEEFYRLLKKREKNGQDENAATDTSEEKHRDIMTFGEIVWKVRECLEDADARDVFEHVAVQVDIIGEGRGSFYVEVAARHICVEPYDYHDRDGLVKANAKTLIAVASGQMTVREAIDRGLLEVQGNHDKLALFSRIRINKKFVTGNN